MIITIICPHNSRLRSKATASLLPPEALVEKIEKANLFSFSIDMGPAPWSSHFAPSRLCSAGLAAC